MEDEIDGNFEPLDFSLREAIEIANNRPGIDFIEFDPVIFNGTITLTLGELDVTEDLDIFGSTMTVNGNDIFRALDLQGAPSVFIEGLRIINGRTNATGQGGGAIRSTGDLELSGVIIDGSRTTRDLSDGGAIFQIGQGLLQLNDSLIINNRVEGAGSFGGAISAVGGSQVLLGRTVVDGNSTQGDGVAGGGIFVVGGDLDLAESTVSNNENQGANSIGGGIAVADSSLIMTSSTVSGNTATAQAGGIAFDSNGNAVTALILNSTISGNSAAGFGGGLFSINGQMDVRHSTVTGNTAPAGEGSGLASYSNGALINADTRVFSTIISGNANSDVDNVGPGGNTITSENFNLVGTGNALGSFNQANDLTNVTDPGLDPLGNNGGVTDTHALQATSPAIDAGDTSAQIGFDQRGFGFPRLLGARVDIGSFEAPSIDRISIIAQDANKDEGDAATTPFTFLVSRTGDTTNAATVDFAVTGSGASPADADDFVGGTLPSGQFTIPAGQASALLTINVAGDTIVEQDNAFTVTISNPTNPPNLGTATADGNIVNDDTSTVTVATLGLAEVPEDPPVSLVYVFTRTDVTAESPALTINFSTTGTATSGTDYTIDAVDTVTFDPGQGHGSRGGIPNCGHRCRTGRDRDPDGSGRRRIRHRQPRRGNRNDFERRRSHRNRCSRSELDR